MSYSFSRSQPPRGMSYPLKRSALDAALVANGTTIVCNVTYMLRQSGTVVLEAFFTSETKRGWAAAGLVSLRLSAVPSHQRMEVEAALIGYGLGALCAWLAKVGKLGNAWRSSDHHLVLAYVEGRLSTSES